MGLVDRIRARTLLARARRVASALLLLALAPVLLPDAASAQTYVTADRPVLDGNGVDVNTGTVTVAAEKASIGDLAFAEMWNGQTRFNRLAAYISETGGNRTVFLNGVSKKFTPVSGGGYEPADQDGSTLVEAGAYVTYTTPDGSEYLFGNMIGTGNQSNIPGVTWYLVTYTRPDGKVYTYHNAQAYEPVCGHTCFDRVYVRVQSVTTSDGYMLKAGYASTAAGGSYTKLTSLQAIDLSVDYCNPDADSCTGLTQSWPSQTISETTSGSVVTRTITDQDSNATLVDLTSNKVTAVDRPGNTGGDVVVTYDGSGRVATLASDGKSYSYSYVDSGTDRTTTVTAADSTTKTYIVDTATSRLKSVTDELAKTVSYQYDSAGRMTRETQPEGNYTQWTYDARGNVTEVRRVAKLGSGLADIVTSASFDATCSNPAKCNKPNFTIDERGFQTDYLYNATHGGVTRITLPSSDGSQPRQRINYTYTKLYPQTRNASGVLVTSTTGQYMVTGITSCRTAAACAGTANETVITLAYDTPTLQLTSKTIAAGDGSVSATETYAYDARGDLASVDGPLAGTADKTWFFTNAAHKLIGVIGPDPDGTGAATREVVRQTYNANRQLSKVEIGATTGTNLVALQAMSATQTIDYTFDTNGNRTRESVSAGGTTESVTQYSYDGRKRLECTAIRMNKAVYASLPTACTLGTAGTAGADRITKRTYDNADRLTKVTSGYGTTAPVDDYTAVYSDNGLVTVLKDGEANRTTYAYDGHDRLVKTRFPVPTKGANSSSTTDYEQLTYDDAGNVLTFRTRANETLTMTYDNLNRLITKVVPDRTGDWCGLGSATLCNTYTRDVYYGYDLFGNMRYARFDSTAGTGITNLYDALGQLTSTASDMDGTSRTLSYQYDAAGNVTQITHPDDTPTDPKYFTYTRSGSGALTQISLNGSSSLIRAVFNATGQVDKIDRWRTTSLDWGARTGFTYDTLSRIATQTTNVNGTAWDLTSTFGYNPAAQISSVIRDNASDGYSYDDFKNANRNYTSDGHNRYTAITDITSTSYDGNGNLVQVVRPMPASVTLTDVYIYDVENRLVVSTATEDTPTTSPVVTLKANLRYDPLGRLYEVRGEETGAPAVVTTTRFLYDGDDLVAEYNDSGVLQKRYVHGIDIADDPLVMFEDDTVADSVRRYLYADERGSIIAVTDGNGAKLAVNTYDEHGIPGNNTGRFQYTGQMWIPELGMYYYKARTYSPTFGRFMQTDPIGYGDGMNLYAYVRNDPVNFVDPTGLSCFNDNGYCDPANPEDDGPPIFVTANAFRDHSLGGLGRGGGNTSNAAGGSQGGGRGNRGQSEDREATEPENDFWDCATDVAWGVAEGTLVGSAVGTAVSVWDSRNERFSGGNIDGKRLYPNNSRAAGAVRLARVVGRRITQATLVGSALVAALDGYQAYSESENCK